MKLDRLDVKILAALQKDGQISKTQLAENVGLSSAACWKRVKRLEQEGLIKHYRAFIDIEKFARHDTLFVQIYLNSHTKEVIDRMKKVIEEIPEIIECYVLSGQVHYFVKVVVKNISDFYDLFESLMERNLGIESYTSFVVTNCVKKTHVNLMSLLEDDDDESVI